MRAPVVLPLGAAIDALRSALAGGLDPDAFPPRSVVPVTHGRLLLMPAEWEGFVGVKVVSVAPANPTVGLPLVQGDYLLLDAATLTPIARLDGVELTSIRTAAMSALAVDVLAAPDASRLVVFGSGPQARGHVAALRLVRPVSSVTVVGRDKDRTAAFADEIDGVVGSAADVADADLVACCTTARTPLFDRAMLRPSACVVAIGSHEPEAVEVDVVGSTVVVESIATALREAGDVIQPIDAGLLGIAELVELADVVRGNVRVAGDRPCVFTSVGMAWQDLVLAAETWRRTAV